MLEGAALEVCGLEEGAWDVGAAELGLGDGLLVDAEGVEELQPASAAASRTALAPTADVLTLLILDPVLLDPSCSP